MTDAGFHLRGVSCGYRQRRGFSLVELLVVLGIIAILLALLLPVLGRVRAQSKAVQCQSNLRQLGQMLFMYANEWRGWLYPAELNETTMQHVPLYGLNVAPHERWPVVVFHFPGPRPLPYNPDMYRQEPYEPAQFPAAPFTPPTLLCPSDSDPFEAHSYVLNGHLAERGVRASGTGSNGLSSSTIVVAGEKRTYVRDYYMQNRDYPRVIEPYRHGLHQRSNCLYLDGHVDTATESNTGGDAWDLP